MDDTALNGKIAMMFVGLIALVVIGYFAVFVLLPIFALLIGIDMFMRASYKGKMREAEAKGGLILAPQFLEFEARLHDGKILMAWQLELPDQAYMEIYRLEGQTSGDYDEITSRGTCIHSTGVEKTATISELLTDHDAPEGVLYYIPILFGQRVEKRILDYGFFSFYGSAQYTTRRKSVVLIGHASRIVNEGEPEALALSDDRDDATIMADEILASIKTRKEMDRQLDAAVIRIKESDGLSEAEKTEAIELLETRSVTQ